MKLSVIIPAFNEAKGIDHCVKSVSGALRAHRHPDFASEVIVVDNNSTDGTAAIARDAGAQVVFEAINQISRARNAGARVATGDWFLFIDADSWLNADLLGETLDVIRNGRDVGGGSIVTLDQAPWFAAKLTGLWNVLSRWFKWAAGSFVFCRADAFREIGGFSQDLFAAEEIAISQELKRWGDKRGLQFMILHAHPHVSSGRKFYLYSKRELIQHALQMIRLKRAVRDRRCLGYFYEGRR